MKVVSFLIFLAGLAIAVGYPWLNTRYGGHQIGTWRVQDAASGFHPIVATLATSDAPVEAMIDIAAVVPAKLEAGQSVLTITAATGGRTVLAETLDIAKAVSRDDSPQTIQQIYRLDVGSIAAVADGDYTFTVGPGDAENVNILSVDLMLRAGAGAVDDRAQPIGFSLVAIGFVLMVLAFRQSGGGQSNPNSQPPPPRWGRDGRSP